MIIKRKGLINVLARNSDFVFSSFAIAGIVGKWVVILS